ncbi:hypothetical protein GGP41_006524 [Bipolaris sorokiniana]|uniref:Uncharacterized protein n=1 Tax=Cochliobolus sativus TaxID=45130 RepID=A0A8H5ZQZ2_COCSA|nr:hypothetical protein GGP41_006524 [Bipolaris sorokiniana]
MSSACLSFVNLPKPLFPVAGHWCKRANHVSFDFLHSVGVFLFSFFRFWDMDTDDTPLHTSNGVFDFSIPRKQYPTWPFHEDLLKELNQSFLHTLNAVRFVFCCFMT